MYARMHEEGEAQLGLSAEQTFPGSSLLRHIEPVKRLVEQTGARTVLDYGCGKGHQYRPMEILLDGRHVADGIAEYWDVDEVRCYDAGYAPYRELPAGSFDGVISTDVLEHCPEEDLAWIVSEIFAFARRFVFLNVACFPANKHLPDGSNAHITVRPAQWWNALVSEAGAAKDLAWELRAAVPEEGGMAEKVFRRA
jgi:SAM-dependent methyltransferase